MNNDGTRYFVTFSIRFAAVRRCCVLGPVEFPNALLPCCTRERDLVLIQQSPHQPALDNLNQQQVCARHAEEEKQEGARQRHEAEWTGQRSERQRDGDEDALPAGVPMLLTTIIVGLIVTIMGFVIRPRRAFFAKSLLGAVILSIGWPVANGCDIASTYVGVTSIDTSSLSRQVAASGGLTVGWTLFVTYCPELFVYFGGDGYYEGGSEMENLQLHDLVFGFSVAAFIGLMCLIRGDRPEL